MKVRLKKDWLGNYKAGEEFEFDEDGYITFSYTNEDVRDSYTVSAETKITINKDFVAKDDEYLELVTEEKPLESSKEAERSMRSVEAIEEKVAALVADRDILKSIDYKYASRYIRVLDNMIYALEWALGKVE